MIIPGQFGFNCPSGLREEVAILNFDPKSKMAATAGHRLTLDPMGKSSNMNIMRYGVNVKETTTPKSNCTRNSFFSDLQMIIPGQFGFNCPSDLREEAAILNFISEQKT
jgi:hypothetical protein